MIGQIPAGRFGTLDDVVKASLYLLGDDASYITGECLTVDGGRSLEAGMFRFSPQTPRSH